MRTRASSMTFEQAEAHVCQTSGLVWRVRQPSFPDEKKNAVLLSCGYFQGDKWHSFKQLILTRFLILIPSPNRDLSLPVPFSNSSYYHHTFLGNRTRL